MEVAAVAAAACWPKLDREWCRTASQPSFAKASAAGPLCAPAAATAVTQWFMIPGATLLFCRPF